jgi:hypothetical protein
MRLLILAVNGGLVLMLAVAYLIAPDTAVHNQTLFTIAVATALLLPLAAAFMMRSILTPLPAGLTTEEATPAALGKWRASVFAGTAVSEAAALVGLTLAVQEGSFLLYLPGFITALIFSFGWVLPKQSTVMAAQEQLEANGTRTQLWETLNGRPV